MKKIDLATTSPTLPQILQLANGDDLLLQTLEGRQYVVSEIDDFDEEIAAVVKNKALMKLLAVRSKETTRIPLGEVRARMNGKKKTAGKARKSKAR